MPWPPRVSEYKHIAFRGLGQRAAELVILVDHMFPSAVSDPIGFSFFDANTSTKRIFTTDAEGNYKSPWKPFPCTITAQTQLIVRENLGSILGHSIRRADICEMFSLIGWFPDAWVQPTDEFRDILDINLASSLVGNAFSAYHIGPVLLAFLAAIFSKESPSAIPLDTVCSEGSSDDDDGQCSISS